ncbi:macro domain-containing protein [Methylococcus sp. EFPC2]|uniref:macro domain-containing protein n=1 Tax=Methylococcus sp. EFPC2 TaxID=2812648 RepID=UPI001967B9BE|nr:macro domain-containing protein [Methylococcus sp. EFPC2]QSA95474.1 macro domain-containing protein [Methylococcus sp. EFPC2]
MQLHVIESDLLVQLVGAIVNPWNRNIIPWWRLLTQGISRAIERQAGTQPFRGVARHGIIPLGEAVLTSPGRLPFRGIIHGVGINMLWRSFAFSARQSVRNAMRIVIEQQFRSVAFPLIGAGSGGGSPERIQGFITAELSAVPFAGKIYVVPYSNNRSAQPCAA